MIKKQPLSDVYLNGLDDAQVEASRRLHGDNVLTPPKRVSLWKLYWEKYKDPIIQILLFAAFVSLLLAFIEKDFMETIGIILAIVMATTVSFYFELDAAKKFRILTAVDESQPVKVRRNGRVVEVPRNELVVGDVILIEVGDEVPADARLVEAVNLQVDESSLTGEQLATKQVAATSATSSSQSTDANSAPQGHDAYPEDMVLRSSMVMNGHGIAVVTQVGDHTEIGKVAMRATEQTDVKTPLDIQLNKLAKFISKVGTGIAIGAFVVFLAHDIMVSPLWHSQDYWGMLHVVLGYFMLSVTLIVMAVPEGLPMAVTLALALNMRRMLRSNNLVRKLHASETMGAVTVICTDKTGTLTQNVMTVKTCLLASDADPQWLYQAIAVNTTAHLNEGQGVGNPTEVAMLRWLEEQGQDYVRLRQATQITDQMPFSTEHKFMMTVVSNGKVYVKGAPEVVLNMCALASSSRQEIEAQVARYQHQGMRVLLLAYAEGDALQYTALRYQAMFAIEDPVREDVPEAVADCQKAGIEVKVVTGDNSATAIEIARQIGVWDVPAGDEQAEREAMAHWHVTGAEFSAMTDDEAYRRVPELRVMSRARPGDKQRLVQLLQRYGQVVAVTGDGTNDAPALNHAHVGLSLGSGTSVAKEASDITLLDDSFHSITSAVMWGRSLYKNIQRFLYFQLIVNLTALLLVLGGAFVGTALPLTVTQILWINLIMDTFAAMALASLPPSREVMSEKPRHRSDFIITKSMSRGIVGVSIVFFIIMFGFLLWCERYAGSAHIDIHELTLFFTTFVMLQFWNLFNAKCLGSRHSAFRRLWSNRGLLTVLGIILAGQWLIVTFGGEMFRTTPLSVHEWLMIIGLTGVVVLGGGELYRVIKRLSSRS